MSLLMQVVKWVFYVTFAAAVLAGIWIYRREILTAMRQILAEFAAWWRNFWGGRRVAVAGAETIDFTIPPPAFATYADPFLGGGPRTPVELVRYSFEAFEAWSREHGCPRELDQTAHELARKVGKRHAFIASDSSRLAELYARAAYAPGDLPASSVEPLRQLWSKMRGR